MSAGARDELAATTDQQLVELKAIAEAATPGEWEYETAPNGFPPIVIGHGMAVATTFDKPHLSDARHIATFDPPTVLALLAEVERHGPCQCVSGPAYDGPEETCPRDGRTYTEWVERGDVLQAKVARVEALGHNWLRLSGQAMDADVREWTSAAGRSVLEALATEAAR